MDGRPAKVRRTETHDLDRRPSPQQQKVSYANSSSDHPVTNDNRFLRDIKDASDMVSGSRDVKEETRVLHNDLSCDRLGANVTRFDSRRIEKDLRLDEKDWTKLIEDNLAKRYSKSPNDLSYSWRRAREGTHCVDMDGNVHFLADVEESSKGQVVTGDIHLDGKNEDTLKEKGRERKDWREKDKHNYDKRSNLQGVNIGEKEQVEERDVDGWPGAISNLEKDNEGKKKMNPIKKEAADIAGMKCLPFGKHIDGPEKFDEQETLALEPRRPKDDFIKGFDGEMLEICNSNGNVAEDGSTGYLATEKSSESLGHGFRQCKRIKYLRGSPNDNRKLRISSKTCDHEGIQGKEEVANVDYKPGESMSKLLKLWKEFDAASGNENGDDIPYGALLDIRIPPKHVSSTNRQLRYAQMWGTDVYTIDSDVVAVLIHSGYCRPLSRPLPTVINELRATIRILPPQDCYRSTIRNNIHSRAWGSSAQCSYCIESCSIVKKGGETIKLEPDLTSICLEPTIAAPNTLSQQRFVREVSFQYNLCNEPWIKYNASVVADKGMRKPLYTSARLKKGEVLYLETQFNRYELCFNGEKACFNCESTSCQTQEFSEKHQCYRNVTDGENIVDLFRWSRCKKPLPENMMRSIGIPLPTEHLVVLEEKLEWEDIQWSQAAVWIAGKEYQLARVHFLSPK